MYVRLTAHVDGHNACHMIFDVGSPLYKDISCSQVPDAKPLSSARFHTKNMGLLHIWLSTLAAASLVSAGAYHHYTPSELVVLSCKAAIEDLTLFCDEKASSYKCTCSLPEGLGSLMNCVYNETSKYSASAGNMVIEYCESKGKTKLTLADLRETYDNATKYLTDITVLPDYNSTDITYVPVYYDTELYKNTYMSTYVRYKSVDFAFWMGSSLLGYWAFIFLIASCYNFLNRTVFLSKHLHAHPINLLRKHITVPAALSTRHTHPVLFFNTFGGFIPTRLESLVLFVFFAMLVCFAATGYSYVHNDTFFTSKTVQMTRYLSDRTGIICLFSFLLSFLFAGRNNFLLWITGWKQSTFLTYHKWISRMNFLMLITHGSVTTIQYKANGKGKYQKNLGTNWMRWGIVALCAAGFIMITASYRVRKTHYEVFVICHLVLVAIFLVGSWKHAADFEWEQFCYVMAAIWCFDRVVRLCRLVHFGVQKAQVTVVSDEILKIVVPRRSLWRTFPGAYGYLHFIAPTTFFQSHPFTIVESTKKTITFFTKIKGGVTSHIHQKLSKSLNKTGVINVSVEGPYGHQRALHKYNTVVHLTGGTGIPTSYAYVQDSVAKGVDQHIKLYWVIRNWKSLDWFYDELLKLKKHGNVNVVVYVTKPESEPAKSSHLSSSESSDGYEEVEKTSDGDSSCAEKSMTIEMPPKALDFIEFRYGRPDINSLVANDVKESIGTVAFVSAAHNAMVDDIRYAVSQNLDKGKERVEYFEELQAW